jgi:hypothetical protein
MLFSLAVDGGTVDDGSDVARVNILDVDIDGNLQ